MTESDPVHDLKGKTLLGLYRVRAKLAEGGMGAIFVGVNTNLGTPVVIKLPHRRFLEVPGFRKRFDREIEQLIGLQHPSIVPILARGEYEGVPFFVLRYLGGGSLEDRLLGSSTGRLEPRDVVGWIAPVARTLDFIHEQGVVHRDVKPANILFDRHGNVFLSDFGLAKVISGQATDVKLTSMGVVVGSPFHMAPEQATASDVTGAADQYALASTLYEVLGGRPPYEGESALQILMQKSTAPPPDCEDIPGLAPEAAAALMRALSLTPDLRFSSCTAFADAFVKGQQGQGAERTAHDDAPVGAGAAAFEPVAASRRRLPMVFLLVLLALGAVVGTRIAGFWGGSSESEVAADEGAQVPKWAKVSSAQRRAAKRLGVPVAFEGPAGIRFVLVPGGAFDMGAGEKEPGVQEGEGRHRVTLSKAYYISIHEVTNAQFRMHAPKHDSGAYKTRSLNGDTQPVVLVHTFAAEAFVKWLNEKDTTRRYGLPTEAQWERAARGEKKGLYPWGNASDRAYKYANLMDVETKKTLELNHTPFPRDDGQLVTAPVGSYLPNAFGLYDTIGNVWEWVRDWYMPYPREAVTDPVGLPAQAVTRQSLRIARGGAWDSHTGLVRLSRRRSLGRGNTIHHLGFRVVAELPAK